MTERARGATRRRCLPAAARLLGLCVAATLAGMLALAAISSGSDAPTNPVSVWIDPHHPGRPVPKTFPGLSFELLSLGQIASLANRGDLVTLLRSLGPGLLRFGGVTADTRVAWINAQTPRPAWASSTLDAAELQALRALAVRSGWRVLLTLNLAHYDPLAAARETAAARAALGSWLAGVEVGNEPDAYAQHGFRPFPWTPQQFAGQVVAYHRAIRALVPNIPIVGPGASGSASFSTWAPVLARAVHMAMLTGHHYPLGCHQVPAPSIERLLSVRVQELESLSLARFMGVSNSRGVRFRLDESNSVSCGGMAAVSDTFASALWAVGYIAKVVAAGVSGINLHGNLSRCSGYSPLCAETPAQLAQGRLLARPVWYALLLARSLIGDRPLRSRVLAPQGPNLSVTALRASGGALHFVIVDRDPSTAGSATVSLQVGRSYRSGEALALTAPALNATSGVRLAGRAVAANGSWRAPQPLPQIPVHAGVLQIRIPPSSAALVTVTRAHAGS